jgi:hypothetical protein
MLYSIPECPVDKYDKEWIEKTFVWFEQKFGKEFIKNREYLIPINCKFKYNSFNSHEAIQYFINFICDYIDLDRNFIEFTVLFSQISEGDGLPDDFDVDAPENLIDETPLLTLNDKGKFTVEIGEDMLDDFDGAFISLVFQLTYIKLFHNKVLHFYNEYLINYAMVLMGFGVFSANIFVRTSQWGGLRYSAWKVSSLGILNHCIYGYLFALLLKYRKKEDEPWLTYLVPDVTNFYMTASAFLDANSNTDIPVLPAFAKDEEVFVEKYFYESGGIYLIAHIINDKMEGLTSFFHKNGFLWSERIYKNNIPYTVLSNYNSFDEPLEKGTLFEGNGTLYIYKADGNLEEIETYKDGLKVSSQFLD